jgi:hypothetical protein
LGGLGRLGSAGGPQAVVLAEGAIQLGDLPNGLKLDPNGRYGVMIGPEETSDLAVAGLGILTQAGGDEVSSLRAGQRPPLAVEGEGMIPQLPFGHPQPHDEGEFRQETEDLERLPATKPIANLAVPIHLDGYADAVGLNVVLKGLLLGRRQAGYDTAGVIGADEALDPGDPPGIGADRPVRNVG